MIVLMRSLPAFVICLLMFMKVVMLIFVLFLAV